MSKKIFASWLLIITSIISGAAQTRDAATKEKEEKLKTDAVVFLREAAGEIANLRTPENRIGFSSELAALMWFHDEKEARVMFNGVTNDFRQMLTQLDAQLNATKFDEENSEMYGGSFSRGANPQMQMYRRFSKAMSVRQQIATALSEHDALLAYSFYNDTAAAITNQKFKNQNDVMSSYFEQKLLQKIAEQDAAKALEFGRKSLEKGVTGQHLELLKKIYAKDAEKGAAFGEDIARKLKSEKKDELTNILYLLNNILEIGIENQNAIKDKPSQKPMFGSQDLRDIAESAAQILQDLEPVVLSSYGSFVENIEKFSPSRAVQIRQKMKLAAPASNSQAVAVEAVRPRAPKEMTDSEKLGDIDEIGTKTLSDEQRAKAIAEAGKMIEKIEDPTAKMMALSGLAVQIEKSGDKDLALQIMKQAETFVNQTPKTYIDFMQLWMLASGYAQVEPDRAFPILETAVTNLNETISAFVKVAEFIDANGEMIEDGEVQVGIFGSGITREFTSVLKASDLTLKNLAAADFARTRNLTNKFDRTEARILAKMLVLRAVLGDANKKSTGINAEPEYGMITTN